MGQVALDTPTDLSGKRFLLVDDMPEMTETVIRMLRHHGATQFFRSTTVEEALAHRRHGDPTQTTITTARLRPYVQEIDRYVERAGGERLWADLETLWGGA